MRSKSGPSRFIWVGRHASAPTEMPCCVMRDELKQPAFIAARRRISCNAERFPIHARGPRDAEGRGRCIREAKLQLSSNEQRLLLFGADDRWTCSLVIQSTVRVADVPPRTCARSRPALMQAHSTVRIYFSSAKDETGCTTFG